ncbi:hypothetical protein PHYPO_G00110760 [Pangasianodon hypophthalmus]|uniref:Uncharacterized protein n=1 Tax=Pangasianodon hypophthalmus TaxID=310915 RepID=A0A5N5L2Q2_PANHP|nr:hypothetical protein PHYPO_G00110760 [Pangasianodon hypophthalmus]
MVFVFSHVTHEDWTLSATHRLFCDVTALNRGDGVFRFLHRGVRNSSLWGCDARRTLRQSFMSPRSWSGPMMPQCCGS